jgi:hypothetical protein
MAENQSSDADYNHILFSTSQFVYIILNIKFRSSMKYDKQDQQGKAAFNERNPHINVVVYLHAHSYILLLVFFFQ